MTPEESAAFNRGVVWTCKWILRHLERDYEVRLRHNWPLDYRTLQDTVAVFCHGELNTLEARCRQVARAEPTA